MSLAIRFLVPVLAITSFVFSAGLGETLSHPGLAQAAGMANVGQTTGTGAPFQQTPHPLTATPPSGDVYAWGYNVNGQLGNGTINNSNAPLPSSGLTGVISVAAGGTFSIALKSNGSVWAWGYANYGQLGNGSNSVLINGTMYSYSPTPVQVSSLTGVAAIAAGYNHALALKSDGTVWAWGAGSYGQLGNGSSSNSNVPVQVTGLTGVTAIGAGYFHSLAVKSDGTVRAWGRNNKGQLGNDTTTDNNSAVQVNGISTATSVAGGGSHSLALLADGTVRAWGWNGNIWGTPGGQLGNGTTTDSKIPVQVSGLTGATAIAAGEMHSLAIKGNGTLWVWGDNGNAQLGNGSWVNNSLTPVQVPLSGVTAVSAGGTDSLALKSDGTLWTWGRNSEGQLGTGNYDYNTSHLPVQVSVLTGAVAISMGAFHGMAVKQVAPQVNLSLTPASQTVTVGSPFTVTIRVTPQGGQQVQGVDAFVNFNPAVLQVDSIAMASGSLLTTELSLPSPDNYNNSLGQGVYSAGKLSGALPSTPFDMAVITLHAVAAATNSPITFNTGGDRNTDAAVAGASVLGTMTGASVSAVVPPSANFSAAGATSGTTTVVASETVNFTDTSTGSPSSWNWDFDTSSPSTDSTAQNPTHVYTVAGTYSVKLTATNAAGSSTVTKTNYITVTPGPLHHITVSPSNPSLTVGGSQTFTAVAYDQYNNVRSGDTITWSVANPAAGSINATTGAFTAGTTSGSYSNAIVATSAAVTGNTSVTVTPGPPDHITINQHEPTIVVGTTFTFTATTYDQYNNARTGDTVVWVFSGPAPPPGYLVDDGGGVARYFAGTVAGLYGGIQARISSGGLGWIASDFTGLTLVPAALDHIVISPTNPSVPAGGSQAFSATTYDQYNNVRSGDPIAWSVANPAAGSINAATGAFTAGATAGSYPNVIQATSGTTTAATSVTIFGPLHHITVSPSNPSVAAGGTQTFTATTYDQYNNIRSGDTIAWSVANALAGSINASTGVFTAGTVPGTYPNAIVASSGTVTGNASVTVTPGPIDHIVVAPPHPTVSIGMTQTFTATAYDQWNNIRTGDTIAWSVANALAGSINGSTGVFTATTNPANMGDYTNAIVATSGAVTGTASVNVTGAVINGTVTLQGNSRPAAARITTLTVRLFNPGAINSDLNSGNNSVATFTPTTVDPGNNNVTFQIAGVAPGTYDITIVKAHSLRNVKKNVTISAGQNSLNFGMLLEGNCNDDIQVQALDFSILASSYLKATGQAGFDARADFDGTGQVNSLDFSMLAASYLKASPVSVP